jgi:hypothetical protein
VDGIWNGSARPDADGSDAFLAGVVTSQVDGDGLQDRIGHQLRERCRCAHDDLVRGAHPGEIQTPTSSNVASINSCIRLSVHFGSLDRRPLNVSKSSA